MIFIDGKEIDVSKTFPDGTLCLKAPTCRGHGPVCITWRYENDAELFALICLRKHYGDCELGLDLLYIPHARMDRVKNNEDVFTLKYFCEIINSLNFRYVRVLDAHSNVALALLDRVKPFDVQYQIDSALDKHDNGNTALFFPDEGAMKRYSENNKTYPFAYGIKRRQWETGLILGLDIINKENIIDKDVLIIDDICSRGGTFYFAAKALLEAGARSVSLYTTHCENTILQGEIFSSGLIQKVYTTDSLVHCDELKEKLIYV